VGGIGVFSRRSLTTLLGLGLTPRARHGFGAYFAPCPPLYQTLGWSAIRPAPRHWWSCWGRRAASVMRATRVTVGASIEEAVSWLVSRGCGAG